MKAKSFNPYQYLPKSEWLPKQDKQPETHEISKPKSTLSIEYDIEIIVSRIENFRLDLTANYQDWVTIGFSFADALGEAGRSYFHRVSRFHPDYKFDESNRQFDKCMRGRRGVSIKSFFWICQGAGIDIRV